MASSQAGKLGSALGAAIFDGLEKVSMHLHDRKIQHIIFIIHFSLFIIIKRTTIHLSRKLNTKNINTARRVNAFKMRHVCFMAFTQI